MTTSIGRREFITLLGGTAAAWPLAARGQQPERMRRIGIILQIAESDPEARARVAALVQGLHQLGWIDGHNIRIEFRGPADNIDRARALTAEMIAAAPDVILAVTGLVVQELQKQTRAIPLVFVNVTDPVDAGLVAGLSRPGGNTTGFMSSEQSIAGKWVELLKELAPGINRILVLMNPRNPGNEAQLPFIERSAATLGVRISSTTVSDPSEIERAVNLLPLDTKSALIALPGGPITVHRNTIFALALQHRLPAVYAYRYYAAEGGLMSYGPDVLDMWRRAASYVDRILKGEKPADLPVQAPVKFELLINLKTARALGLDVPPILLTRADEVIE